MQRSSIHVGVDTNNAHASFVNDARALAELASAARYDSVELIVGDEATLEHVTMSIDERAATLAGGDLLLLSFAVHGASDGHTDEILQLRDQNLDDGELESLLIPAADRGVRVVLLVDACMAMGISWHDKILTLESEVVDPCSVLSCSMGGVLARRSPLGGLGSCNVIELAAAGKREFASFGLPSCRREGREMGCFTSAICAVATGEVGDPPQTWKELHRRSRAIVMRHTAHRQKPTYTCGGPCDDDGGGIDAGCDSRFTDLVPFPLHSN